MKLAKKFMSLLTVLLISVGALAACGNNDTTENNETPTEETTEEEAEENNEEVDAMSNPTSGRGTTAEELIAGMSSEGAWVFGLGDDIVVDGELVIEGEVLKHSGGEWTDLYERKIGFYQRDADRNPIGAFNLTVTEGIIVNSPNAYFLSDGEYVGQVIGNVTVNTPNFQLMGVEIDGDLVFATEADMESAKALVWDGEGFNTEVPLEDVVTGTISVK